MAKSDLEDAFLELYTDQARRAGMKAPWPEREYRFHPTRKWRFDFAWHDLRVAVEIDGAVFSSGRHSTGIGIHNDMDKHNAAVAGGWRVLRFDVRHLSEPEHVFHHVMGAMGAFGYEMLQQV